MCPFGLALGVGLSLEREREALSMPDRDLSQSLASTGSSSSRDRVADLSVGRPAGRPPVFASNSPSLARLHSKPLFSALLSLSRLVQSSEM